MNSAIKTLKDLVAINSVNPACQADGAGETECGRFVAALCRRHGIDVETQKVFPKRHNIIARVEGKRKSERLLFVAHQDTVSTANMSIPPFKPTMRDGKIFGRGSCDTKASMAAMLAALVAAKDCKSRKASVTFLATVDEEIGFSGVTRFAKDCGKFDGAVVGEPTELNVITAHKGCVRLRVTVRGKAAHTARPELGVNAISKAARLVARIEDELIPRVRAKKHPLLGCGEMTVSLIGGGTQINFVPDRCWMEMDRRTLPSESGQTVAAEVGKILRQMKRGDREFVAEIEPLLLEAPALETMIGGHIVGAALSACKWVNRSAKLGAAPYATEASFLARAGIPSVVLGPGSVVQAHTADEWVEVQQVELAAQIYQRLMERF
jgi:acetylornithine deacetylase